nr:acetamidase [Quercus suber]
MEIAKKKLKAAGHSLILFNLTEGQEVNEIANGIFTADGGAEIQRDSDATGEPLPPTVEWWVGRSSGIKAATVSETWQNQHRRTLLAQRFLEKWQATKQRTGTGRPIDGLIMPSTPFPASHHNSGWPWHYGELSALLDLTTGVFPVTRVDSEKDRIPPGWNPITVKDKETMEYYGKPTDYENAPVGLALVGRRLEEEKVTAMLTLMRDVVGVDY